jgi:hypothetical protein
MRPVLRQVSVFRVFSAAGICENLPKKVGARRLMRGQAPATVRRRGISIGIYGSCCRGQLPFLAQVLRAISRRRHS